MYLSKFLINKLNYLMCCRYAGGLIHGKIADTLYARGTMSLVNVRRVFNSICLMGPAIALVLLSWSGCDTSYVVALG